MPDLFHRIIIDEGGGVITDKLDYRTYFEYLQHTKLSLGYVRLLGLPPMKAGCLIQGGAVFVTEEGDLMIFNRHRPQGLKLETGLPPIKQIFPVNPLAILDMIDILTFIYPDKSDQHVHTIEDVKQVDPITCNKVLTKDNILISGDRQHSIIDNPIIKEFNEDIQIFPNILVDQRHIRVEEEGYGLITTSEIDYKVDDCIYYKQQIYTISDGILRVNGEITSDDKKFARFIILDCVYLIENEKGKLYDLAILKRHVKYPFKLIRRDERRWRMSKPAMRSPDGA